MVCACCFLERIVLIMDSVDCLWIRANSLHRGFMYEFLLSFIKLEKQYILLNIFIKLRNTITADIFKREKQTISDATGIEFSFEMRGAVVQQNLFFSNW